ncbi:MAG: chorismate synthase [Spirochaetaceae bacterium]|nr:chorismate synthase [Spirochaetaceae bacterium]
MGGSIFGSAFKVTTFGESHGLALGVVVDGCPAGIPIEQDSMQEALNRRRPGNHDSAMNMAVTTRKESDKCEILSGVFEGKSTGTPIAVLIQNTAQHSKDYDNLKDTFRPGHADFTYDEKYGFRDYRGGGRASGRETAARVAAGYIAKSMLQCLIGTDFAAIAYTLRAAGISCENIDTSVIEQNPMRAPDMRAAQLMNQKVQEFRSQGDSCGGIVECCIQGLPAGLGEPVFDKLDAQLAKAMLSIGGVKGVEFGAGFMCSDMTGSSMNDPMRSNGNGCFFESNNAGGILGGISNGNQIVLRVAVKPVPSIFKSQQTVKKIDGSYQNTELKIEGRHDVCLCPRIVPVVEAMVYITVADLYLRQVVQANAYCQR